MNNYVPALIPVGLGAVFTGLTMFQPDGGTGIILFLITALLFYASPVTKEIKIKTANGSIKGTIGEEQSTYSIESHTVNGRNNLSNIVLDSDKKLIVETANGSINIQFKE